jgi:YppF-like protein
MCYDKYTRGFYLHTCRGFVNTYSITKGGVVMTLQDLKQEFVIQKKYEAEDLNELMDFLQICYVKGTITISTYRNLIKELELLGATKPEYTLDYTIGTTN